MRYRKIPVEIEAVQWDGFNINEIKEFVGDQCEIRQLTMYPPINELTIHTLEGDMRASKGDYIIKGVQSEFYPCKEDIFLKTYEIVSDAI